MNTTITYIVIWKLPEMNIDPKFSAKIKYEYHDHLYNYLETS